MPLTKSGTIRHDQKTPYYNDTTHVTNRALGFA
jgi:hypothetical protein